MHIESNDYVFFKATHRCCSKKYSNGHDRTEPFTNISISLLNSYQFGKRDLSQFSFVTHLDELQKSCSTT